MIPEPVLLRPKIRIPLTRPEFVRRPRLTERINLGLKGPLTVLSAPAGFGKTQALVEWAPQSIYPVAWLTLSPEDNDVLRFYRYVVSALQVVEPNLGEETLDYLLSSAGSRLEAGLTLLINEISAFGKDVALVLDDYHLINDPSLVASLYFSLAHLPPNLHLVIASRGDINLDLAPLRAKGQLTQLGVDELRLTNEEIEQFFKQTMRYPLPTTTIQALAERTEGWVVALQLAALSLRNQPDPTRLLERFHGDAHYMVDFLAQEVLDRQSSEVQQFLLRSSILDILSGSLCEAVVEPDAPSGYGTTMLRRLEHLNLFLTPLDERHQWYRFHNLFADFLRHVLTETHAAEISLLHKRAATWFEQQGNLDEAFKHGSASGDMEWAANLIDRNIEAIVESGEISPLTYWTQKLPREHLHQRPRLGLAYAWGLVVTHQLDEARFWLEDVQQALDMHATEASQPMPTNASDNLPQPSLGELALVRSMLALASGDFQQAAEYSSVAVSYLKEGNPFIKSVLSLEESMVAILVGDTSRAIEALQETVGIARRANNLFVLIVTTCELAEMQALQGRLSEAMVTLEKARLLSVGSDERPLILAGLVDNETGELLRERNRLEEAQAYLERGLQLTQSEWSPSSQEGKVSLARLLQSQGDVAGAQALIADAFRLALSAESGQWDRVFIAATAIRLALQRDDLAAAYQWREQSGLRDLSEENISTYPYHVLEYLLLTRARFDLAIGKAGGDVLALQRALELLQSILPKTEQFRRITSRIEGLLLKTMIEDVLAEHDQAVDTLISALALGEPEGYRRIYLDEGRAIEELLPRCQDKQQESGTYFPSIQYIESLLDSFRQEIGRSRVEPTPSIAESPHELAVSKTQYGYSIFLSARELEVLSLIAEGKSNQEIAEQLYLALNTVKRHASNIYDKLEVRKRTEAIAKARQLGLIL